MDFWDTAATVRELSLHPFHPNHPLYVLSGNQSARFNPYTLFWGLFMRATRSNIFTVMAAAGVVNYIIFCAGLYRLLSNRFKSRSLPSIMFLVMLWVWGTGYLYANAYNLQSFLITLPYIGFFAFGLTLHALYLLNAFLDERRRSDLIAYCAISALVLITHPITGLFCYVAAAAFLLESKNRKLFFLLQIVPAAAACVSLLWPYFSFGDLYTKNLITAVPSVLFKNEFRALGIAIAGFPISLSYALRKQHISLLLGFLFCLFIYVFSYFAGISIGGRFILYCMFFLHLAISLFLQDLSMKNSFRGAKILVVLILLIVPGIDRIREMAHYVPFDAGLKRWSLNSPVKQYLFLSDFLKPGDVLLAANWQEGFPIPAFTGAKIVEPRQSFTLLMREQATQRKIDAAAFFHDNLRQDQRVDLIKTYQVTHILLKLTDEPTLHPTLMKQLSLFGKEIARNKDIVLYRVEEPEQF